MSMLTNPGVCAWFYGTRLMCTDSGSSMFADSEEEAKEFLAKCDPAPTYPVVVVDYRTRKIIVRIESP